MNEIAENQIELNWHNGKQGKTNGCLKKQWTFDEIIMKMLLIELSTTFRTKLSDQVRLVLRTLSD